MTFQPRSKRLLNRGFIALMQGRGRVLFMGLAAAVLFIFEESLLFLFAQSHFSVSLGDLGFHFLFTVYVCVRSKCSAKLLWCWLDLCTYMHHIGYRQDDGSEPCAQPSISMNK